MTKPGATNESQPEAPATSEPSPGASDIRATERGVGLLAKPSEPPASVPDASEPDIAVAAYADPFAPLAEGTVLQGTYVVQRLLGRGAMGAVYVVEHTGLGKQFAAKVVDGARALDASAVARLRNEARITSAIEHENIVNVTHLGQTTDGRVFIVMELLRGQDLRKRMLHQLMESSRIGTTAWLPDDEVRATVPAILSALAAAHAEGVVHRDLKPDNVFLSETKRGQRRPKIVDFGIGKLRDQKQDLRLTDTGHIIGTPLYMAPEQSRSSREVDHRADLYSLAVMTFEMMCGRPPFEAAHVFEMVVKHATEEPPDPRSLRADLPDPVAAWLLRGLAKDPDDRFQSASDMLDAWHRAWGEEPESRDALASSGSDASHPAIAQPRAPADSPKVASSAPRVARSSDGPEPIGARASRDGRDTTSGDAAGSRIWIVSLAVIALVIVGGGSIAWWRAASNGASSPSTPPTRTPRASQTTTDPASRSQPRDVVAPPPTSSPANPATPAAGARTHHVTSEPTGAELVRDGRVLGRTPFDVVVPAGERIELDVRLRGRRDGHVILDADAPEDVLVRLARPAGNQNRREDFPGLAPR